MTWWNRQNFINYEGIICDGAVRSGKTLAMTLGFILWSMTTFQNQVFGICGKTIGALRRNIIIHLPQWLGGIFRLSDSHSENRLTITCGRRQNTYYLFGGQDESAAQLIQGITLAGVLLDEAALMPRSFVEQACARCSVTGSKLWFNCNPEGPEHWFYKEWILCAEQKGMLHLHFTMEDNPGLAPSVKSRYHRLYSGVFYRRFVLGQWCLAEGLVYEFDPKRHISTRFDKIMEKNRNVTKFDKNRQKTVKERQASADSTGFDKSKPNSDRADSIRQDSTKRSDYLTDSTGFDKNESNSNGADNIRQDSTTQGDNFTDSTGFDKTEPYATAFPQGEFYISVDYGTRNPFSAGLWFVGEGKAWRIDEFYHDGRASGRLMTDEQYCDALEALAGSFPVRYVVIDPSAASMIAALRLRGRFSVRKAKNAVLPGIRLVQSLLGEELLQFSPRCTSCIREFSQYRWQEGDSPLKENDHAMDDVRYFCSTVLRRKIVKEQ